MRIHLLTVAAALLLGAFTATSTFAQTPASDQPGALVPAKEAPSDWVNKAKADYPLDHCVVSDEKLEGDMGGPVDYVYKQEGKPDRLVRFCCKNCVKDFKKNPAKYLTELDKAAAAKAQPEVHSHSAH